MRFKRFKFKHESFMQKLIKTAKNAFIKIYKSINHPI